jgi:hypothetical protein
MRRASRRSAVNHTEADLAAGRFGRPRAVAEGGPLSLIEDRRPRWLCEPDADELAAAVAQLAASPFLRERIARTALAEVQGGTWEAALAQLAAGGERTIGIRRRKPGASPLAEVA